VPSPGAISGSYQQRRGVLERPISARQLSAASFDMRWLQEEIITTPGLTQCYDCAAPGLWLKMCFIPSPSVVQIRREQDDISLNPGNLWGSDGRRAQIECAVP
jgi:hypothetical protein